MSLLSGLDNFEISISHTTRKPRAKEIKNKEALANPEALVYFANIAELGID